MPNQPSDTVTVTIDAEGDQRTLDLPEGFVDLNREPDDSAAELVPVSINAMRDRRYPKELIDLLASFAAAMESVDIDLVRRRWSLSRAPR